MVIFDLVCSNKHNFEGWFKSTDEYNNQLGSSMVICPFCDCTEIEKNTSPQQLAKSFSQNLLTENQQLTKAEKHAIIEQLQDYVEHQLETETEDQFESASEHQDNKLIELQDELPEEGFQNFIIPSKKNLQ